MGVSAALALCATALFLVDPTSRWLFYGVAALTGGALFPIYSLGVAHANDLLDADNRIQAASSLLLVYGVGASLGPPLAGLAMEWVGTGGLFAFCAVVALWLLLHTQLHRRHAPPLAEEASFVPAPDTTPGVILLDPRVEVEAVDALAAESAIAHGTACEVEDESGEGGEGPRDQGTM